MKLLILLLLFCTSSLSLACSEDDLCKNDRVAIEIPGKPTQTQTGKVHEVYSDGRALVFVDSTQHFNVYQVKNLKKAVPSIGSVRVGDRIVTGSHKLGKEMTGMINELFSGGFAAVLLDKYNGYPVIPLSQLGVEQRCNKTSLCECILKFFKF